MRCNILVVCFFIAASLMTGTVAVAETPTMGQKLKGYEFERKKAVQATRSIILDFLKNDRTDSLKLAVSYCDSLTSPDSSWLSDAERYCIYFLCVDTHNLYQLDFYCKSYSLYDTANLLQAVTACRPLYSRGGYPAAPTGGFDNLEQVLLKTCKNRLPEFQRKYPDLNDIWEFWSQVVLQPCVNDEMQKVDLKAFRKKYPLSPLARLKVSDYGEMQKIQRQLTVNEPRARGTRGGGGLVGAGYTSWLGAPASVYPDLLEFSCSIDMIFNGVLYQFAVDATKMKMKNDLTKPDTLKKGTAATITFLSLNLGHAFGMGKNDYLAPLGGVYLFQTIPSGGSISYDVPFVAGARIGIDYTHVLGYWGESFIGPAIRVSTGVFLGDFKRISDAQGYCQLYINLSVGIFGFGAKGEENRLFE